MSHATRTHTKMNNATFRKTMGKLTETLFPLSTSLDNSHIYSTSPSVLDDSFFNIMDNFDDNSTELPPIVCKMHLPTWLNLWCVFISVSVLMLLVILGILVRYIQVQKQRVIRSEIVHVSPDFYQEHYLDRSQIMVY
ncbi:uncharacterized protein ACRADG_004158 [Cochliomyia hominivorax]